jgi:hypothetical protein
MQQNTQQLARPKAFPSRGAFVASCLRIGSGTFLEYRRLDLLRLQTTLVSLDNLAGKLTALLDISADSTPPSQAPNEAPMPRNSPMPAFILEPHARSFVMGG